MITVAEKIENILQLVVGLGFRSSISENVDNDALGLGFVERDSQQIPRLSRATGSVTFTSATSCTPLSCCQGGIMERTMKELTTLFHPR